MIYLFKKKEKIEPETELVKEAHDIGFKKDNETKHLVVGDNGKIVPESQIQLKENIVESVKEIQKEPTQIKSIPKQENEIISVNADMLVKKGELIGYRNAVDDILGFTITTLDAYLDKYPELHIEIGDKIMPILKDGKRCPASIMTEREQGHWDGYTSALYEILYKLALHSQNKADLKK